MTSLPACRWLRPRAASTTTPAPEIADDRDVITGEDKVVLIVEDDVTFAPILLEAARQKGFRGIVTVTRRCGRLAGAPPPSGRDHARHPAGRD